MIFLQLLNTDGIRFALSNFLVALNEMGFTPLTTGLIVFASIFFLIAFGISSAYMSKDSLLETDPLRLRAKAKLKKKIAADAEMQKRLKRR